MLERALGVLTRPQGPALLTLLALLISLPALRLGFQADDHIYVAEHARGAPFWSLFQASPAQVAQAREIGGIAWWASPEMSAKLLRPLAWWSHAVMLDLAKGAAWAMSLLNVLVYAACVWLAARIYRRLLPAAAAAALAGLMFAIDDAHAHSVGWISAHNTLLALLGSLATLAFHMRAVDGGKLPDAVASALALIFALASGEAGVTAFAYLIAHAAVIDTRAPRARLIALSPHLVIGATWAAIYVSGGYGVRGTSWYADPSSAGAGLASGLLSAPLTVTSLLGPSLISLTTFAPLWKAQLAFSPLAALLLWLVWPALWASRASRFFGLAAVLAAVPALLTVPQDRVLIGASFGAFGLIAGALTQSDVIAGIRHKVARVVLRGCHVWLAGLLFIPMLSAQHGMELTTEAIRGAARGAETTVLINSPLELFGNFVQAKDWLEHRGELPPRPLHQLYAGGSELFAKRVDERAIELTVPRGWGYLTTERVFCRRDHLPRAGDVRRVGGMTIETLEHNPHGLPIRVRFTFDIPLDSPQLRWLVWAGTRAPIAWQPPAMGEQVRIAPADVPGALSARR